jgi:hypothetical protein
MENIKSKESLQHLPLSEEVKNILKSMDKVKDYIISSHRANNSPIVVEIDGKIVNINPFDLSIMEESEEL